jgi:hypothetical protein
MKLERIRPPKREQVQFLFPSLGLHCIAGCVLRGSLDSIRGEEGADSSNMMCIHILILRAAARILSNKCSSGHAQSRLDYFVRAGITWK